MKKLLPLLVLLLGLNTAFAQEPLPLKRKMPMTGGLESVRYGMTYLDTTTSEYLIRSAYIEKFGKQKFKELKFQINENKETQERSQFISSQQEKSYVYRLKPAHTIAGCSMIGAAFATYALSNSMINQRIADATDAEKIKSLNKTNRTIGYICAGVSVVGVVVVITGLHKEYTPNKGIAVANNCYIDANAGMSMALTF